MKPRLIVSRQMPAPVGARIRDAFDCPWPDGRDMDAEEALQQLRDTRAEALLFSSHLKLDAGRDRAHPRACAHRRDLQRRLRAHRRGGGPRARHCR